MYILYFHGLFTIFTWNKWPKVGIPRCASFFTVMVSESSPRESPKRADHCSWLSETSLAWPVPRCRSSEKWLQDLKSCRNYHDLPWFTMIYPPIYGCWIAIYGYWIEIMMTNHEIWVSSPRKNLHAKPQALRKLQLCSWAFFQPSCRTKTSAPACSACHQLTHVQWWNPHVSALCWNPNPNEANWSQLKPMKHGEIM